MKKFDEKSCYDEQNDFTCLKTFCEHFDKMTQTCIKIIRYNVENTFEHIEYDNWKPIKDVN